MRIEAFVQKRVRQELESEAFLLALEKKIEDAKKSLTDKLLATVEKEVMKAVGALNTHTSAASTERIWGLKTTHREPQRTTTRAPKHNT